MSYAYCRLAGVLCSVLSKILRQIEKTSLQTWPITMPEGGKRILKGFTLAKAYDSPEVSYVTSAHSSLDKMSYVGHI